MEFSYSDDQSDDSDLDKTFDFLNALKERRKTCKYDYSSEEEEEKKKRKHVKRIKSQPGKCFTGLH